MVIGVLKLFLTIPDAMSLKDKRRAIKSLKDKLGAKHNITIAEVDYLDEHRRCLIAVAMVSRTKRFVESCLSKIVDKVRSNRGVCLEDYDLELL